MEISYKKKKKSAFSFYFTFFEKGVFCKSLEIGIVEVAITLIHDNEVRDKSLDEDYFEKSKVSPELDHFNKILSIV